MGSLATPPAPGQRRAATEPGQANSAAHCDHCGTVCRSDSPLSRQKGEKVFCCAGCETVFALLHEHGLGDYYRLNPTAGVRVASSEVERFRFLDDPGVRERMVDYQDETLTRVTFRIPAIHCIACVWLLENLFRLKAGVGPSRVHFPRKEISLSFRNREVKLSEVVSLLASLGYEPELKFSDLDRGPERLGYRKLWLQLGVAGFAFGNNMLFSIALYFGVDVFSGPAFRQMVGLISLALAIPVLLYSAQPYFQLAWNGIKHRILTIEVPIAAGILVIFAQSTFEVLTRSGDGYFDSFSGLLFFLLGGRLFQQKTYDRLAFDRDFKSFFPLSITRQAGAREETVALSQLRTGDALVLRHGELIPADSRLVSGEAFVDYSFVTGEAEPVRKNSGDLLYAGGRQTGGVIVAEMIKPVSQSYLTSLWNQAAFQKGAGESLDSLINRYSQRFTLVVAAVATAAAGYWAWADPRLALKAFTSVLIVACPCALALAAPFTLGTALRVLARRGLFLKSTEVVERLGRIDTVVFDKTGTLTAAGGGSVQFCGDPLSPAESRAVSAITRPSTHPHAVRIGQFLEGPPEWAEVRSFQELPGRGLNGSVAGREVSLGSAGWLASRNIGIPEWAADQAASSPLGSVSHVALDGEYRGAFVLASAIRPETAGLLEELSGRYQLALLSGDHEKERARFAQLFPPGALLRFHQSPLEKLEFIRGLQSEGRRVMMVGDGLNDAGALQQSEVGVAVVERVGAFSPASDVILSAGAFPRLADLLRLSGTVTGIVRISFLISSLYNLVGIGIAATGRLSPVVCAILMPLSSISVVAFACAATEWAGRRHGFGRKGSAP